MRIAFLYGNFSVDNRDFDFSNLWNSKRGLTGSEISCIMFAKILAKRGYNVDLFTKYVNNDNYNFEGITVRKLPGVLDHDVVFSWNEPDLLTNVKSLRLVNQQLNDFEYCKTNINNNVDVFTSPSKTHAEFLCKSYNLDISKFEILPNGCSPDIYTDKSVKGRVIFASSPDRGLHLLLQEWPKIKKAVPYANLKIFYNYNFDGISRFDYNTVKSQNPIIMELAQRARYCKEYIYRLKDFGVEYCGSKSRSEMVNEFNEASVLAFPCSTVNFTEGFSVTTMEACASYTAPIISSIDSLGEIYNGSAKVIDSPIENNLDKFVEEVILCLTDEDYRQKIVSSSRKLAINHDWELLANKVERIIKERLK